MKCKLERRRVELQHTKELDVNLAINELVATEDLAKATPFVSSGIGGGWMAKREGVIVVNKLSICSELLLRIDSMVLSSMISPIEASELRSLVINHKVSVADVFDVISDKRDSELLGELRHFSNGRKKNGFYIVHICTEMVPLVPGGSVASYVTGISRALQRKGHVVEVILPKYTCLNLDEVLGLREVNAEAYSYFNGQLHRNRIWTGVVYGIGVTLIEPVYYSSFFNREMIYGYPDDFERDKLAIAPYGFDKSTWDPSTDYFLPENFNAEKMDGKTVCKAALQQRLGLADNASNILASVSPLVMFKP
ncbi:hypothetical protein RIF29_15045 [Crotalaria pallida]|uniref:starch synthase n=1 Tax=Crotalaria pallida TaxID=3830 RepID=A0AAN9FGK3_CROPI